jgi:hypothetical protein
MVEEDVVAEVAMKHTSISGYIVPKFMPSSM